MRQLEDWLTSYVRYANVTEAPRRMHFWSGVSALAAALRRKVWVDMDRFTWIPNFYIVFVAPPGVVSKSTTAGIAERLMRKVEVIKMGANVITSASMAEEFGKNAEGFIYNETEYGMSPLTFVSSELGSLINMQDKDMINLLIELWDGKEAHAKSTKTSGKDQMIAPWINILGCTTPAWVSENMPMSTMGGGFTSRCIFLYAEEKERYIAWPSRMVPDKAADQQLLATLVEDLNHIANELVGPMTITEEAMDWFEPIYEEYWKAARRSMGDRLADGYVARKQTHIVKLSMIFSIAQGDSLVITKDNMEMAIAMLADVEAEMHKVFARIGKSENALNADRLISIIRTHGKPMDYQQVYQQIHWAWPDARDFEGILAGLMRSGQVTMNGTHLGLPEWTDNRVILANGTGG